MWQGQDEQGIGWATISISSGKSKQDRKNIYALWQSAGGGWVQYEQGQAEKGEELQAETGLTKQDYRMIQGKINQNYTLVLEAPFCQKKSKSLCLTLMYTVQCTLDKIYQWERRKFGTEIRF
jgi:hypothetical protein